MSNRFHNKFHRHNHHSLSSVDPNYPDAGFDPIASYLSPFKGEFFSHGDIVTTADLSAKNGNFTGNVDVTQNLGVSGNVDVTQNLGVSGNVDVTQNLGVSGNVEVLGNLSVLGNYSLLDTQVTITSATQITNDGTLTALTVTQTGEYPIAHFFDDTNTAFFVSGSSTSPGYVGIGTDNPNKKLTVSGDISASGTMHLGSVTSGSMSNDVVVYDGGELKTRNLTTATIGGLNANFVPKVSSTGSSFEDSSIYDNGSGKIGINTIAPISNLTVNGDVFASSNINTAGKILSSGVDLLNIMQSMMTFTSDLTVNLKPGYTFGKYKNLDIIPSTGKTVKDVVEMALFDHVEPMVTSFNLQKSPLSLLSYETDFNREKGNVYSDLQAVITKSNFPLDTYDIERFDSISGAWSVISSVTVTGDPSSISVLFTDNDSTLSSADFINYRIKVKDTYQTAHSLETYSSNLSVNTYSSFYAGYDPSFVTFNELSSFMNPVGLSNSTTVAVTGIINNGIGDYTYFIVPASKGPITSIYWNGLLNITGSISYQPGTFIGTNVYGVSANYIAFSVGLNSVPTDIYDLYW